MAIGTMFTLFVTPMVYTFLARDHAAATAQEKALGHIAADAETSDTRTDHPAAAQ